MKPIEYLMLALAFAAMSTPITAALFLSLGLAAFLIFLVLDAPRQRALDAWIKELEDKHDYGV